MSIRAIYARVRRRWIYGRACRAPLRLIILRYHSVGEPERVNQYLNPALSMPPRRFREQIRFLRNRFDIVTPDDIAPVLDGRKKCRPSVVLTFDDGYIDNYEVAVPILLEEQARATFYVATDPLRPGRWLWTSELWRHLRALPEGRLDISPLRSWIVPRSPAAKRRFSRQFTIWCSALSAEERERVLEELSGKARVPRGEGLDGTFLNSQQVRAIQSAGMTIGAHTRSHPQLDLLPAQHRGGELAGSRLDLEEIMGRPVHHLAYPNPGGGGVIKPDLRAEAERAGFRTAVTSVVGAITRKTDRLRLPRIGVYAGDQEALLFDLLDRLN